MTDIINAIKRKLGWKPPTEHVLEEINQATKEEEKPPMKDIVHIHVIKSNATMEANKVRELCETLDGRLPYDDDCFLVQLNDYDQDEEEKVCEDADCETVNDDDAKFCKACGRKLPVNERDTVELTNIDWKGEDSGKTFHQVFVKQVVPHIRGRIEAVALLEGDEDVKPKLLGFTVQDGIYTKCDVDVELRMSREG